MRVTVLAALMAVILALSTLAPSRPHAYPGAPVGIASVSTMLPGADYSREAAQIRAVGATAIRIPAKWNLIQHDRTTYDWARLDAAVASARSAGLWILMDLQGPAPGWAQAPGAALDANGTPPQDPGTFGVFAQQVALRYSRSVTAWEIWSEPNLPQYLVPPTAAAYLPLLVSAYTGIRSTGSRQPVIVGGTSSSPSATPDTTFIADLYRLGGRRYFDAIGVHPYTFPSPIRTDHSGFAGGAAVIDAGRQIMLANGDGAKKMWVTEYGQATGPGRYSVSEGTQAVILADAARELRAVPWIAAVFLFTSDDLAADSPNPELNFGLYHFDGTPKPAVSALQSVLR